MSEEEERGRGGREVASQGEPRLESPRLIVGIGASAGGLEAFRTFLENMPPDSGMAFVLVQHLLPKRPSMLAELLGRHTAMPLQEARNKLPIEPNRVYVIPPNASLTVERGRLRVIIPLTPERHHTVIDRFFHSLAEDQGPNAVGIILSGAGHEGTLGVKVVKEHGGLTMAQSVATAAHASMPGSAAAAGFVDLVLDVDKMPQALLNYADNLIRLNHRRDGRPIQASLADHLERIYALLRDQEGHDFSKYKENTVLRRVQRHMQVLQLADVGAYVERLEGDPGELNQLFRDLLIGVTRFFRDPAAFEALAHTVIPALVEEKGADGRIRVWVPGCGSGEEAYSIGILLLEELQKRQQPLQAQIFATDIDEAALATARAGLYPEVALADVPRERVERFFVPENGLYRVTKNLRAMCMFAGQNVVADPPFSRLDLISCRNLLIYLGPELQARLLPLFHYALRENGFLFLGSAETIGRHNRLFTLVDRKHRIFRQRIARLATRPSFPADAFTRRTRETRPKPEARAEPSPAEWGESVVLQQYAPSYFVIDEHFDVIQFSARLASFLDPAAGGATLNVFGLIHPELRLELRAALQKAKKDRTVVTHEAIRLQPHDGPRRLVDLVVNPRATGEEPDLFLVLLRERLVGADTSRASASAPLKDASIEQLEDELSATRERLHTSIEQLETLNEELSSSNEELLSTNEELQSSNEELEASQEELQSLNEELETVNSELRDKVDELDRAHNDLLNLFDATAIATLFLDTELRIERFTPRLSDVIAVQHGDEGRLVGDFALRFEHRHLLDEVRAVMREGATKEVEIVRREDGRVFLLRIAPYRTSEHRIEGAVLTFVDISRIKEAEQQLQTYRNRAEVAIGASGGGLYEHSVPPDAETYYNDRWAEILGYPQAELPDSQEFLDWLFERIHPEDRASLEQAYGAFVHGELDKYDVQARLRHKDGHWVWVRGVCQPLARDATGQVTRVAGLMFDATAERVAAEELRQAWEQLRLALDAGRMGMWELDLADGRVVWDERIFALLDLNPADAPPSVERFLEAVHPEDRDELRRTIDAAVASGEPHDTEFRIVRPDGSVRWLRGLGQVQRGATGRPARLVCVNLDTTEPRQRRDGREPPAPAPKYRNGSQHRRARPS